MASYSGPKQSAWSRPHVQTSSYDARQQENVAAPPYNLQAAPPPPPPPAALPPPSSSAPRPHTYLINDTFLSRKPDRLDGGSDSHSSTPPFLRSGLSGTQRPPTSNAPREVPYPFLTEEKVAEEQHAWKQVQRGGHGDQYQRLAAEAPSQLPPPPPSANYRPSLAAFHVSGNPARQSGPRSSSPRMYGATHPSLPPPPPPPPPPPQPTLPAAVPYGSRHVRTPSSPHYGSAPIHRDHPPQSPVGRELPAPPMGTRPSSSMSILSMLGTDPGRPPREAPTSTFPITSQPSGSLTSLMQYSTSATSPTKSSNGSQGSPPVQNTLINRPFRAYSGGSASSGRRSSPSTNALRFGALPVESLSFIQNSPQSAGAQEKMSENGKHMNAARMIHRPNSQPAGYNSSTAIFDQQARDLDSKRAELARQEEALARSSTGFLEGSRSSTFDLLGRHKQESTRHVSQSTTQSTHPDDRIPSNPYPFLSKPSVFNETATKGSKPEYSYHPRDRATGDDKESQHLAQKSPFDADALRRVREERLGATTVQHQHALNRTPSGFRPRFLDNLEGRAEQVDNRRLPSVSSATAMERTRSIDSIGRTSEDLNNHRHSLAIMLDNGKRGRVSPLPQAVQGAQSRPSMTPSRDPGIKNEFSKMFAGIGSGVTGVGGSGASTPFPPSPRQSVEQEQRPFGLPNDGAKITEPRDGSQVGKRRSRVKDDEVDKDDGRLMSISADGKVIKRAKHNHRHHVYGHRHHRDEGTPLRNVSNPGASIPAPHHSHHVHHHHHHADGSIHHHHHSHVKQPAPNAERLLPPPRMPRTIVDNKAVLAVLDSVPLHHLGSTVYTPCVSSRQTSTRLSHKLDPVASSFCIPPQFPRENCTLTIRVPHFYLKSSSFLHITAGCALWGTGIYSDDSDPICAAIHAGWIQGAWPDNIDVSMLEPGLKNVSLVEQPKDLVLDAAPTDGPISAPLLRDMHITVAFLPGLQCYSSTIAHGVKSRSWGDGHDGLSYRIEKIAFVPPNTGSGQERRAAVRKERIDASMNIFREQIVPVRLRTGQLKKPIVKTAVTKPITEVAAGA